MNRPLGPWRGIMRHLDGPWRQERRSVVVAAAALALEVGCRVLEPWPVKVLFDSVLMPGASARPAWMGTTSPLVIAAWCGAALLLIVGLRAMGGYVQTVTLALTANRMLTALRASLYRRLQVLPLSFHNRSRAGDLTVRLTGDVGMLQDVALTAALPLIADAGILVGMLGLMFWMQPGLTLFAMAPLPLFLLRWRHTHHRIREVARVQRRRDGAMAASAAESLAAIKTVQALALGEVLGDQFTRESQRSASQGVKGKRLSAGLERSVDLLIALSTGLLLWAGTTRVLRGAMTPGELLVFAAYLKTAFKPLQSFAKYTGRLGKATAAAERVLEVLDIAPEGGDRPAARPAPPFRGHLRLDDVSFSYTPDREVLRGISASIPAGQLVAIVGASGSGKSTLANLLLRLHEPTSGIVRIDGHDLRDLTRESVRAQVGVVLQDTILFAGTIRDNLTLGAGPVADSAVHEALALANAEQFVSALPLQLDTAVGERGVTLSNGQRQRLALARAALRRAPLMILDEPTVGLDEENERAVSDAILRLARGRTTMLVTHALHLAARADRVLVLSEGRLAEDGSPSDLLRAGGVFAQWYRDQAARMHTTPLPVPHAG